MKKMLFSSLCIAMATTVLLLACKKTNDTSKSVITCTDSAWLLPDSFLTCSATASSNYKMFYLTASRKDILVAKGTFTDIDTVVNGGSYLINFDSIGTVPLCGAIVTKANLTCHTKL